MYACKSKSVPFSKKFQAGERGPTGAPSLVPVGSSIAVGAVGGVGLRKNDVIK